MKKLIGLVLVSALGGAIALGSYTLFFENQQESSVLAQHENVQQTAPHTTYVSNKFNTTSSTNADFTSAAQKTVHAVVHIRNKQISQSRLSYLRGVQQGKEFVRGSGSGVIITPDGYIVTNNHVIEGANELEVTLNNNLSYKAKVIGSDPEEDIALIKINAKDLDYLPFGNSDNVKIGEWALAVGNPFNLTSTVTAGIISAKGRDLNENGTRMQSFLQTDAAINPGNSGGALVNINGELIGINSAITSRTGSYIGYGFAVPSNNARKIVEDLMEYGNVKHAILGITGSDIDPVNAKKNDLAISQGVHVQSVSDGAKTAGLREGDLITKIDGVRVRKISDLTAYIRTKRPDDKVQVNFLRNGQEKIKKVKLTEYETFALRVAGVEVANASKGYLKNFNTDHGVRIAQTLSREIQIPPNYYIITAIDDQPVKNVSDVKSIINGKHQGEPVKITFKNIKGQVDSEIFR